MKQALTITAIAIAAYAMVGMAASTASLHKMRDNCNNRPVTYAEIMVAWPFLMAEASENNC